MIAHLLEPFARCISSQPDADALWIDNRVYSYAELGCHAQRIATWCQRMVPQRNPRIGILTSRSLTAYASILGVNWASGAYLPLNARLPASYLATIVSHAELDGLIVDSAGLALLDEIAPEGLPVLAPFVTDPSVCSVSVDNASIFSSLPKMRTPAPQHEDDTAYQMFTSGTTGTPKGIAVSISNLRHLLNVCQDRYRFTPEDRVSQAHELTFDLSILDIFTTLLSGASLHVVPDRQMTFPAHFIRTQKLSICIAVPSVAGMLSQMKMLKPNSFPSLRWSLFCGEALPESTVLAWKQAAPHSRIDNLYGPTEVTVACLRQECTTTLEVTQDRGIIAIGKPFPGQFAAIVNERGDFLPTGEVGELALSGPQVTPGYWRNAQLTASRYPELVHPQHGETRWYLTGDLARCDADDRYHFLGRVDNQIKLRGQRIELDEIECYLREVSDCDNAVVVIIEGDTPWSQEIIGIVSPAQADVGELRNQLRKQLPAYKVPKRVVAMDNLPRNASGKIDRLAIRQQLTSSTAKTSG